MTILEKLDDLIIQATKERSHYYVKAVCEEAKAVILDLMTTHDWQCGCGHWNGPNLPFCAQCERRPGSHD